MNKATMTTGTKTMALCVLAALTGCGGTSADPMTTTVAPTAPTGAPAQAPLGLPTQPTDEVAPTGTLDPQLVGSWPVTGVQVYWAGTGVPDGTASDSLQSDLAGVSLVLSAGGTFTFGPVVGTWVVVPFITADKAMWGTGGRGPDGYARELVLAVNGRQYTRGPIEDPSPPATAPWGLNMSFQVQSPQAGTIMVILDRPSMNTGGGAKK